MPSIEKSSVRGIRNAVTTVGTTAVPISADTLETVKGVWLQPLAANAGEIYLGGPGVTTSNGLLLAKGEINFFPAAMLPDVYLISGSADQTLKWVAI